VGRARARDAHLARCRLAAAAPADCPGGRCCTSCANGSPSFVLEVQSQVGGQAAGGETPRSFLVRCPGTSLADVLGRLRA
jgi:hypothetical protein